MQQPTLQQLLKQVKELGQKEQNEQIIALLPDSVLTEYNHPELYSESGHSRKGTGDYSQAIRDFTRAIALASGNYEYYSNRGSVFMTIHDYEKAIKDFSQSLELNPNSVVAWFNRGESLRAMEKYKEALDDYNKAVKIQPGFVYGWLGRGNIMFDQKEYDKAIWDFDKVISMEPGMALAWHNRGNAWFEKEKYNKAIEDFTKVISLQPNNADAYCDRGNALFETKQYDRAIMDFNKAIELIPGHADAIYGRADVWYAKKEFAKAVEDYTKFIDLRPYDILGYNNRGFAWRALKEYDKAIEDYTMSIGLEPTAASEYFSRGNARSEKLIEAPGTIAEATLAIKDYDEAIRLDPGYSEAYCHRGIIWSGMEEYDKAIDDFEKALQLDPSDNISRRWLEGTKNRQNHSSAPLTDMEKQAIREKAISFINEIRDYITAKCKKDKNAFQYGWYVKEWDKKNGKPVVAGLQGWIPEVKPGIAKWAEIKDEIDGKKYIGTCTLDGEEFWPSLVGIPIKKDLWRAIAMAGKQYRIGEKQVNEVKDFAIVNRMLERTVERIRSKQLDHEIVFGEYALPSPYEEFEAIVTKLINTPYNPRKKNK